MSRPPPADSSPALRTLTRAARPRETAGAFNAPEQVRVQALPCALEGLNSKAVHFPAGVRTNPHLHPQDQHIVVTHGVGVGGDETGVRVVRAGDVISNPPGAWHWHGAHPTQAMTHVTVENPAWNSTSSAVTTTRCTRPTSAPEPLTSPSWPIDLLHGVTGSPTGTGIGSGWSAVTLIRPAMGWPTTLASSAASCDHAGCGD